jgi:hypothetical protein
MEYSLLEVNSQPSELVRQVGHERPKESCKLDLLAWISERSAWDHRAPVAHSSRDRRAICSGNLSRAGVGKCLWSKNQTLGPDACLVRDRSRALGTKYGQ